MRFEVLGPIRVSGERGEIPVTASRERRLLAMLLLHANHTVLPDRLVDAIWGARPPPGARSQLQGCVFRLRKLLAGAGDQVIRTDAAGYRAAVAPDQLDLLEFRRLVEAARDAAATGRARQAITHYRAALALWRGPTLAGIDSEPVHDAAVAVEEERARALEERLDLELADGAAGALVPELAELVREHPYRETLHRALMLALYRAGRQADALAAYRRLRQVLHDEFGTEPGTELRRLHQQILNRAPTLDPPAGRPASTEQAPVPRELPADVPGFTGRADALKALDELLPGHAHDQPGPVVISAIAGTAGVGKTALAVHWAHRVADRFPDGQLYLNLRGYATGAPPLRPIEALSALLRSLGTPPEQIPTDEARAAARYRTTLAHRRLLIVLDNARTVDQVRPLLPGNPGCLVLITSRDNLTGLVARDGARRLVLDLLDPHEAAELVVHLLSPDRADAEPGGAAELARACAHLPLAIRIAAAHLLDHSDQTMTEYTSLLAATDRLAALRIEGDEAGAVLAALEMSYQRTPAAAQRLFRLLGLVPGPSITAVAAAALLDAPAPEAASLLRHLTRIHLIEECSPDRFAFHDLLRLYAQRLAEEQDGDEVRAGAVQRLFASYLHTVASAATVLYPELLRFPLPPAGDGQPIPDISQPDRAMAWLSAELPNLVAAIEYAAEHGPRHLPWRLADQLRGYFLGCRNAVDHLGSARMSLLAAERDGDPTALAVAHLGIASYYFVAADYPASIEHATSAAEHAGAAGWLDGQAAALGNLGVAYGHLGHLRQAAENHARSLALKQRTGRLGGQAVSRSNLGMIYEEMGRLWQAEEQLTSALDSFHQIGSARGEAAARSTLACVYHQLGRLELASTHASRAFEAFQDIGDQDGQSGALGILALVSSDAGQLTGAQDYARASMSLAMEIDNAAAMTMAHIAQGTVQLLRGRPGDARAHHQRALELARDSGHRIGEVTALLGLSAADRRLGRLATAAQAAQDCLDLARRTGYRVLEGRALTSLAEICGDQRDLDGADRHANEALRAHRETGHRLGEARTLAVLGQIADARGQPDHARQHRREALALFHDIGAPAPEDVRGADVTESGPAGPG